MEVFWFCGTEKTASPREREEETSVTEKKDTMQRLRETLLRNMEKREQPQPFRKNVDIFEADTDVGLTEDQVRERKEAGWIGGKPRAAGKTEREILLSNIFTFFNLVFVVLAALLIVSGSSVKNMTFLVVAGCNAVIGIVQEIRAKRAVDRLTLVSARPVRVIREGHQREIPVEELVRDDIAGFGPGDQLPADGILRGGEIQVDESLLTGESDAVTKRPGDEVMSGSCLISGHGWVQLTAVGADSFAARLTAEARANPQAAKSEMMRSLDKLIKVVGFALIPVGLVLFCQEFVALKLDFRESVEGTVAALVGMIPEGLYLLTSIAMAASALKLSRERVLVRDMNCIESLARVDVLCVDKTGTITENAMQVENLIPLSDTPHEELEDILAALYSGDAPDNDTGRAMADLFSRETDWTCEKRIPFSSVYKWSGGVFPDHGAYLAGAPEFILGSRMDEIRAIVDDWTGEGYRVLLVAAYGGDPVPGELDVERVTPLALCLLTSPVRENAGETFGYFREQGVSIRVISGDSARTASRVALRAGISGAEKYLDAAELVSDGDYIRAAAEYVVFGRVTPEQKRKLIAALQAQGHTVAMTGDGVNDLLAMKQADCSIAMASGAQAASQVASLVLLDSDFSAMPGITAEGRRVINNIQRAAALFLVKNIFSIILSLLSLLTGWSYPFEPIHLTVISALTIGIPSFFLAMEPNYERVQGRFLRGVLRRAFPGGLTNVFVVLMAQAFTDVFGLQPDQTGTICAGILGVVGLMVLFQVCKPIDTFRKLIWSAMAVAMVVCFTALGTLFELRTGTLESNLIMAALLMMAPTVFIAMLRIFDYGDKVYGKLKKFFDDRRLRKRCGA